MGNVVSGGWLRALRRPTPRRIDLRGARARRRFCGVSCADRASRLTSGELGSILPVSDCFGKGKCCPFLLGGFCVRSTISRAAGGGTGRGGPRLFGAVPHVVAG